MSQDVAKFMELLKTDEGLQGKLKAEAENYNGDQTPEAVFQSLLLPAAEEAGYHFSWEDYQEYVTQQVEASKELNLNEMEQVAGGECSNWGGAGIGGTACYAIGVGGGSVVGTNANVGFCWAIGIGWGGPAECEIQGK